MKFLSLIALMLMSITSLSAQTCDLPTASVDGKTEAPSENTVYLLQLRLIAATSASQSLPLH